MDKRKLMQLLISISILFYMVINVSCQEPTAFEGKWRLIKSWATQPVFREFIIKNREVIILSGAFSTQRGKLDFEGRLRIGENKIYIELNQDGESFYGKKVFEFSTGRIHENILIMKNEEYEIAFYGRV